MSRYSLTALVVIALALGAHAQSIDPPVVFPPRYLGTNVFPPRYQGTSIAASMRFDSQLHRTTRTVTLTFGRQTNPAYTVEYAYTYTDNAGIRPNVIDEIVTRHLPNETEPQLEINVDGSWSPSPFPMRLTSHAAFTRSIPADHFTRLVQSDQLQERIFGAELVFSDLQLKMLRQQTVDAWQ